MSRKIVIIGNGISGITAARNIRKKSASDSIIVISSESDYFFSRTALMYVYMGHMKFENIKPYEDWFWKKNKIELVRNYVSKVDTDNSELLFSDNQKLKYDVLIIATGSKPNKFGWPGQELDGVQGLYSLQDLELMEKNTSNIKRAVIVGGGLIGIEMAEMLKTRNIDVTFLVREQNFWDNILPVQEAELIGKHIRKHQIDLRLETELAKIEDDGSGKVCAVLTKDNDKIDCEFVGLAVGVSPNIDFLKDSNIDLDRGILVDEVLQTNIKNVFAIGDCAQHRNAPSGRKDIEQVWYTGRIMGETVAKTIEGTRTEYRPGIWFNSAKFFDIEYQTYGTVLNKLQNDEEEFYWQHRDSEKCIHFIYERETKVLRGVNVFGVRMRQQVFENWLEEKRDFKYVLENLKEANFDPEFFEKYEVQIAEKFNSEHPTDKVNVRKPGLFERIFS